MDGMVRIIDFAETPVAALEHRGDPALIGRSVERFIAWRKQAGLPPTANATFNILYDDPGRTPAQAFRLDICTATSGAVGPNADGIVAKTIAGGRCAVLRHVGGDDGVGDALSRLLRNWLPASGEQRRDAPVFLQRFPEATDEPAVLDIFLPLR